MIYLIYFLTFVLWTTNSVSCGASLNITCQEQQDTYSSWFCSNTPFIQGNFVKLSDLNTTDIHVLEFINFEGSFDASITSAFEGLRSVSVLYSSLDRFEPESKSLDHLQLYHNIFSGSTKLVNCCPNLEKLVIKNNSGLNLETEAFTELTKLKKLYLTNQSIPHVTRDTFKGLRSLKKLSLINTSTQSIAADAFHDLTKLKELYIQDNTLEAIDVNALNTLRKLNSLTIYGEKLKALSLEMFSEQRGLREIGLPLDTWREIDVERSGVNSRRRQRDFYQVKSPLLSIRKMDRWVDKVAIVTGASAGIGAAISKDLVEAGVNVVGMARRIEKIEELSKSLCDQTGKLYALRCDVTKEEDILRAFRWITENVGPVHILINNAGLTRPTTLVDGATEEWRRVFEVNVMALCICTREAVKIMRHNNIAGHIVHMNSIAGHHVPNTPKPSFNVYPASKYAVTALTESLRQELRYHATGIKVTSISPGLVRTEFQEGLPEDGSKEALESMPALKPEDISQAVMYVLATGPTVQVQELTVRPMGDMF
ncbi:hypothetical protein JTB14_031476 [Gonioctena quinquepunctata]|nr:hypothetical protein JTB14_031476 [Gonioctena quinquepunctata]